MSSPLPGAVVYATNIDRVAAFYQQVVGLTVADAHEDHVVLEGPHIQVVVVAIPEQVAATIEIADPVVRRSDTALKLHFPVESIAAARAAAVGTGGVVDPAEREWSMRDFTACDGHDPEGNVIQVRQPLPRDP